MRAFALLLLAAVAARADSVADEAEFRFRHGAALIRRGETEEALSEFLASNRLVHNRNVVFNIARSFELLGRFNEAYRWYQDELREPGLPFDDVIAVDAALQRLRPRLALLRIESIPPGATVYIDRKDLGARGQTPLELALPPGKVTVLLEQPGYRETSSGAALLTGATRSLFLEQERIYGAVALDGTPRDALVRIAGEPPVPARGTLRALPGPRVLHVEAPGHAPADLQVAVPPDGTIAVHYALTPLPAPSGDVVVRANVDGALLRLDGREVGFTPHVVSAVPAGRHKLEVVADGREGKEQPIEVAADARTYVDVRLRPLQPRVVAAERQLTRADDAPASVTVISGDEIRAFGYQTLAEALRSVRGLFVTSDRSYDSFGVRGFSPPGVYNDKVLVLSDGHVTNDVSSGQGFIGRDFDVALDDVDRVEVVRGPGSVLYGSAAFFAVVNVVHRRAGEGQRLEAGALAGSLGESAGTVLASAGAGARGVTARFSAMNAAGEPVLTRPGGAAQDFAVNLDGERALHGELRAHAGDFAFTSSFNRRRKSIATGPFQSFGLPGTSDDDERFFVEGTWSHDFAGGAGVDARVSQDGARTTAAYAQAGTARRVADWSEAELRVRTPLLGTRLFVGGEVQQLWRADLSIASPSGSSDAGRYGQTVTSFYAGDDVPLGRLAHLSAAVRYDAYVGDAQVAVDPQLNPRVALIVTPREGTTLKLMGGTAYRAPSINERFFHGASQIVSETATNHLLPETVRTGELEVSHALSDETQVTVSTYWSRIADILRLKEVDKVNHLFAFGNRANPTFSAGVEGEVRWTPRRGALVELWYGFNHIRNLGNTSEVPNAPAHTGALRAMAPLIEDRLTFATELVYGSARATATDALNPEAHVGEQLVWNAGITGQFAPWRLRYGAFVDNLLDETVLLPAGLEVPFPSHAVPQLGRTLRVEVAATF